MSVEKCSQRQILTSHNWKRRSAALCAEQAGKVWLRAIAVSLSFSAWVFSSLLFSPFSPSSQTGRHMSNEKGEKIYWTEFPREIRGNGTLARESGNKSAALFFLCLTVFLPLPHTHTHTPSSQAHSSFSPCYQLLKLQVKYE